nr:hypothetical protein [Tanacetum cinerariifolium]
MERDYIMKVVYSSLHVEYFNITAKVVKEDEESAALQAIEFWSSICDEEIDILEDYGVARTIGDDTVPLVMPFIEKNIRKPDWRQREGDIVPLVMPLIITACKVAGIKNVAVMSSSSSSTGGGSDGTDDSSNSGGGGESDGSSNSETGLPVPYGFKLMQTAKLELIKNQPHGQNQNVNVYMYRHQGLQTRPDETNYLGLHEEFNHDNMNSMDYLVNESQEGGVSKQILNFHRSNDFTAHSSSNPFGGEHQINGQHSERCKSFKDERTCSKETQGNTTFQTKLRLLLHMYHESEAVLNPYPYAAMDKAPAQQLPTHRTSILRRKFVCSDENIWDAFGSDINMDGGASNLLDDNEFSYGLPSLQSGSWSALMQSAVAEASSSVAGLQEELTGVNFLDLNKQTPLADVNFSNTSAMGFGVDGAKIKDDHQRYMRFLHDEIGHDDGRRVNFLSTSLVDSTRFKFIICPVDYGIFIFGIAEALPGDMTPRD